MIYKAVFALWVMVALPAQAQQVAQLRPAARPQAPVAVSLVKRPVARPASLAVPALTVPAPSGGDVALPMTQPAPPPLRTRLPELIASANLGQGVSVRLVDMADGVPLFDQNSDVQLPPASVTKILTALYALTHFPQGTRFKTRLTAFGDVQNGILQGDLVLAGGGDPTLDSDDLNAMAAGLAARGITGITGRFLVWGGALPYVEEIAPEQMDHLAYNPAMSGLNLNYNRVHMQWRRQNQGYGFTFEARGDDVAPKVAVMSAAAVGRSRPIYQSDAPDRWSISRAALGASGARWLPVRKTALYSGAVFRTLAGGHGITLPAPDVAAQDPGGLTIVDHSSAPVQQIVRDMLYYSTNLTAEVLGVMATKAQGGTIGTIESSAAVMQSWLAETYGADVVLFDHSGLDDQNRVSAKTLTTLLMRPDVRDLLMPVLKDIEALDVDAYPGEVRAKTGTLNFVSTLAGYVTGFDGHAAAFAILSADVPRREAAIRAGDEVPQGAPEWNRRAKELQDDVLKRWRLISAD